MDQEEGSAPFLRPVENQHGIRASLSPVSLTLPQFNGENWFMWRKLAVSAFRAANAWELVSGEEQCPAEGAPRKDWSRRSDICFFAIFNSLSNPVRNRVATTETAPELWQALEKLYSVATQLRRDTLFQQIIKFPKMEAGSSLHDHISKFENLVNLLESAGDANGSQLSESQKFIILTCSLSDEWDSFASSLRAHDVDYTVYKEKLLAEADMRAVVKGEPSSSNPLLYTPSGKGSKPGSRTQVKCDNCGRTGHTKPECRSRKPSEKSHANRGKGNDAESGSKTKLKRCYFCGKEGHLRPQCEALKRASAEAKSQNKAESSNQLLLAKGTSENSETWVIDSGATKHSMKSEAGIIDPKTPSTILTQADGTLIPVTCEGTAQITTLIEGNKRVSDLPGVLVSPVLQENLFSVPETCLRGNAVLFIGKDALIADATHFVRPETSVLKAVGSMGRDKLWRLKSAPESASIHAAISTGLWHRRLGHLGSANLDRLPFTVKGVSKSDCTTSSSCRACSAGKMHRSELRTPFKSSRAGTKLELIHSDICGPIQPSSSGGKRYVLTFTDDYSRKCWAYTLKTRGELIQHFKTFKALVENQSNTTIKTLRCDRGGEYRSREFQDFCQNSGIILQYTPPRTPELNGVAERLNRTLEEKVTCMLTDANAPKYFWAECLQTAVYLKNLSPTSALTSDVTPEEIWTGTKPNVGHLRVWGCVADVLIPSMQRAKFAEKSWRGVFVGYEGHAYRIWNPARKNVTVSRDVTFHEDKIPEWESLSDQTEGKMPNASPMTPIIFFPEEHTPQNLIENPNEQNPTDSGILPLGNTEKGRAVGISAHNTEVHGDSNGDSAIGNCTMGMGENLPDTPTAQNTNTPQDAPEPRSHEDQVVPPVGPRRSTRIRHTTDHYWKFGLVPTFLLQSEEFKGPEFQDLCYLTVGDDPKSVQEALNREDASLWQEAIDSEMSSQAENDTWELVDRPVDKNIVSSKMLFKTKYKADGSVDRYKARLVARGFSQTKGLDYDETFAPVVKFQSVRALIGLAASQGWCIHQMDVKTAFLQGNLKEEVYMEQPHGLEKKGEEAKVCKLKKSIYGLKQSPRAWYERLEMELRSWGFKRFESDHSVFVRGNGQDQVILAVYVDDLIISGPTFTRVNQVKEELSGTFKMVDMGELTYLLGIEVLQNPNGILLSQRRYAEAILEKFGMTDCRPTKTPLQKKTRPRHEEHAPINFPYREAVGSLMYLMVGTRPDLAAGVGYVSRYLENPGKEDLEDVKRILRYVKGTTNYCLRFERGASELKGFCDADWGGCLDSRRSTSGYVFLLGGGAVSWKSKRQESVALSSTEAEYMAACLAAKEAVWLRRLLEEMGVQFTTSTTIFTDNQSSLKLMENPVLHERTKHVDIRYHFTRDTISTGQIDFKFIPTDQQAADSLTKGVPELKVKFCAEKFGLVNRDV